MGDNGVVSGPILVGHFLTRRQVARRAGIDVRAVAERPDLLRIGGTWLEEVYFAFQFDARGVRQSVGVIVAHLRRIFDDESVADWLVRPNSSLSTATPLAWLSSGGSLDHALAASEISGPIRRPQLGASLVVADV